MIELRPYQREALCAGCGLPFAKKYPEQKSCSARCRNAAISRATAAKRGDTMRGRGQGKGYRKVGGDHEHRVVAERMLGRKLLPGETVHHDNENKQDNREANIKVLPSQSEHIRLHSPRLGTSKYAGVECTEDGCTTQARSAGYCNVHYQRRHRRGLK